jgi:hypothetical protein
MNSFRDTLVLFLNSSTRGIPSLAWPFLAVVLTLKINVMVYLRYGKCTFECLLVINGSGILRRSLSSCLSSQIAAFFIALEKAPLRRQCIYGHTRHDLRALATIISGFLRYKSWCAVVILTVVTNLRYSSSLRLGHTAVLLRKSSDILFKSGHKSPRICTTRVKYFAVDTNALF